MTIEDMTAGGLVARAKDGDIAALEALLGTVKDDVYRLSLRMLGLRADAEDATQEILVKVITHLSEFRGESAFRTWVHSIAARDLLRAKRSRREEIASFETIEMLIAKGDAGPAMPDLTEAEVAVLAQEVRLSCTQGMVLSLDREQRISWILAEVFDLSGEDAALVLGIDAAAHRKRLSRARERLGAWMKDQCGLVNVANACRCKRQVPVAMGFQVADLNALQYVGHPESRPTTRRALPIVTAEVNEIEAAASALKDHPEYAAPAIVIDRIRDLIQSGRYKMFDA
jgi:RNA polymerase sigma factor (sigma-70 family)